MDLPGALDPYRRDKDSDKRHFFANACIAVAYLLWPALVVQALRILDCSVEVGGIKYVASSVGVKCNEGAHNNLSFFSD